MQSAIVLDGDLKSALAIVRSLGERGVPLAVGGERETGMALHSRYTDKSFTYPSPYTDREGFIAEIERQARSLNDKPVIFTCSDVTFLVLYAARERLASVLTLIFPDPRAIEIAFDKAATYSLARAIGIPTITTHLPVTPLEAERVARSLRYPAVVKPRKSVSGVGGTGYFGTARFVHSKGELLEVFETLRTQNGESPIVQERMSGEEYGVETIALHGSPTTFVVHHRMRSLSPTGGASVLKETCERGGLYDMLVTYAERMIHELRWEGPIMVEFKVDSDTKTPYLMEVNGRFWGSLPLSVASGVPFPWYAYEQATTGVITKPYTEAENAVVTRHFWGDVQHLIRVFFSRDLMRPHLYPKRLRALSEFFHTPKGTRGDVWLLKDPKPALMEPLDIWRRRKGK